MSIESVCSEEELYLYTLAYLGTPPEKRALLEREISHLISPPKIEPVSWKDYTPDFKKTWKQTSRSVDDFWKEHKTEILLGAELALIATGVAVTAATGGIAAVGLGIFASQMVEYHRDQMEKELSPEPATTLETPPSWEYSLTSDNFELLGTPLLFGAIGGIAGISVSQHQNEVYATAIQALTKGLHLRWTYNASHTIAVDILESLILNYHGYSAPASLLTKHWKKFAKEHKDNPDAKYFQLCHSQGASHVRNALERCSPELQQRIIVLALAPSEVVPKALCHASFNYASKNDIIYYGKILSSPSNYDENLKLLEELILLEPHEEAPFFDHGFQSPTFQQVLEQHLFQFIEEYG